MERPWYGSYPEGVSRTVDISEYSSALALVEATFTRFADSTAYVCMGRKLTYRELDAHSAALASAFCKIGLTPGDRVAIMMPNVLQYPITLFAAWRAGLIAVNVNPMYTPRELDHQLSDSDTRAIVILDKFLPALAADDRKARVEHAIVASSADSFGASEPVELNLPDGISGQVIDLASFDRMLQTGRDDPQPMAASNHGDIAALQYTGGTTGVSKGAILTHANLLSSLLGIYDWTQPGLKRRSINGQMNFVGALPLYHVYAFVVVALFAAMVGGKVILIPNPRDMDGTIEQLKPFKLHIFPAVNTLFNGLINTPSFTSLDFSELVISVGGGAAIQEGVARKWLGLTGCPILEGYGLSETAATATSNRSDLDAFTGTVGVPNPGVDICLLDDEGNEVAVGEPGEVCIKGGQVMRGYWNRPEETAGSFTQNGYFKTGDVAVMDKNGYFKIVDRKKDIILVSGFNVYPNEIEAVAATHPGVLECAVVGVPDEHCGEAVMLFVVAKDPALTTDSLAEHCRGQLTGYKRPRRIELRESIPKSNVGKILRRELRDEVLKRSDPPQAHAL